MKRKSAKKCDNRGVLKISLVFPLIFALLLISLVYAQQQYQKQAMPWIVLAIVAVAVGYLVVASVYMVAKSVDNTEMVSWSHKEFFQVTATLFIIFIIFFASIIENYVVGAYASDVQRRIDITEEDPNHAISMAKSYLSNLRAYILDRMIIAYMFYLNVQSAMSAMMFEQPIFVVPNPLSPSGVNVIASVDFGEIASNLKSSVNSMSQNLTDMIGGAMIITLTQVWFLDMIRLVAFTVILPLGIVLRTTPFTRNLGSAMMAVAIGFYLVYPLTFLLNYDIAEKLNGEKWMDKSPFENPLFSVSWKTGSVIGVALETGTSIYLSREGVASTIESMPFATQNLINVGRFAIAAGNMMVALQFLNVLAEDAARTLVVFGAVLPILNIVITFGITREIAALLGTDVSLDSLLDVI